MGIFDKIKEKLVSGEAPELQQASDQNPDDIQLANWVKSKIEEVRGQSNRAALEAQWMRNTAAVMGFTGLYWDTAAKQYKPIDGGGPLKKNRLHSNMILPACQNRLARLCSQLPKYEVSPNSMSEDDKQSAELGLDLINQVWDDQQIHLKRISAMMFMQQCGHVWMTCSFDSEEGKHMTNPETGELMGKEGAISVDVCSPFEVFVDPLAKTKRDIKWLVRAKVRKLDYFKQHWPDKGDAIKEEGAWLLSTQYDQRINTLNSASQGPGGGPINEVMKNAAIELSYYEASSSKHPNGRLVIVANGVVLEDKELPVGEIPYVKFDDIIVGGKFYPEATVTHAIPIQEQYNKNLQRYSDWTNKLLAGKYLAARGHGLMEEAINDQSGEIVEYDPVPQAGPPQAMDIPVMPQYVFAQQDSLQRDLNQIFGLSDVSRGVLPSAGIPAIGMQLLVQQDETRIGIEVEQHEHSYAELGSLILKYIAVTYKTERILRLKKGGKYRIKSYTGEDLNRNFDVTVVRGSTVPNNLFLKRQEIMNAYEQGLLGDPTDPATRDKVLTDLQFGDSQEIWKEVRIDKAQVKRHMDLVIDKNLMPEIDEMDNHNMFIKEVNDFRKTEEYEMLDPVTKRFLLQLREGHLQMKIKLMNPELPQDDRDLDDVDEMEMSQVEQGNVQNLENSLTEQKAEEQNAMMNEMGNA